MEYKFYVLYFQWYVSMTGKITFRCSTAGCKMGLKWGRKVKDDQKF